MASNLIARTGATAPVLFAVLACLSGRALVQAPADTAVRLPRAVLADGQPLGAGAYAVRLSDAPVTPVVGQAPDGAHWVEFVQAGQVKGREIATVVTAADLKAAGAVSRPPSAGAARVDLLKGGDYLRVWINRAGTQYLIHLAVAGR